MKTANLVKDVFVNGRSDFADRFSSTSARCYYKTKGDENAFLEANTWKGGILFSLPKIY